MATEVIMPKAGMSMVEGTVVKWLMKEGDAVKKGDPILEIMTDKVNMEVEAEIDGTLLKIVVSEGEVIPVFTVIAYIGVQGEEILKQEAVVKQVSDVIQEAVVKQDAAIKQETAVIQDVIGKVRATPAARKFARDENLKIQEVEGSGPKNRIQKNDVEAYLNLQRQGNKATPLAKRIAQGSHIDLEKVSGSGYLNKIRKSDLHDFISESQKKVAPVEKESKIIPMKGMRKIIAQRMSESYFTAPVVTLNIDVDMTAAKDFRSKVINTILGDTGHKITYTDIFILVVTKALMKYPIVNATLVEEGIQINDFVNMALAVGLDEGLLVPVIRGTDKMSLTEIVCATKDIVERTKKNKLVPNEMEGSTFTISNLGMYGITHFTQIINQPNSAILGVNAIIDKMVVIGAQPLVRPIMTLSLTIDHRVMDGAPGAKFLQYIKQLLENPMMLML